MFKVVLIINVQTRTTTSSTWQLKIYYICCTWHVYFCSIHLRSPGMYVVRRYSAKWPRQKRVSSYTKPRYPSTHEACLPPSVRVVCCSTFNTLNRCCTAPPPYSVTSDAESTKFQQLRLRLRFWLENKSTPTPAPTPTHISLFFHMSKGTVLKQWYLFCNAFDANAAF